ncbi:hypothetical protein BSKO_07796 [Bryopsis sp. KO-2023]|nr:hypothetical protein BSKO_07796 [Bryopsis sp. KO-2023]
MSFTGGKLKLKGDVGVKATGIKKKKKKKKRDLALQGGETDEVREASNAGKSVKETPDGVFLPPNQPDDDRRTEAEKAYDEKMDKREDEQIRKIAFKSHRERVKDFNEYLANLTEHHDIPKVGPG